MQGNMCARFAWCVIMLVNSVASAQAWQPKKQVTAVGLGDLSHGNKARAREDAIANARKNALEQTVGVHI